MQATSCECIGYPLTYRHIHNEVFYSLRNFLLRIMLFWHSSQNQHGPKIWLLLRFWKIRTQKVQNCVGFLANVARIELWMWLSDNLVQLQRQRSWAAFAVKQFSTFHRHCSYLNNDLKILKMLNFKVSLLCLSAINITACPLDSWLS